MAGIILVKFWMHISKEEQLRRFGSAPEHALQSLEAHRRGLAQPREVGPVYGSAVEEMLLKTSTLTAPWTVVEGDYKWWARVKCVETLVKTVSKHLDYKPSAPAK